MSPTALPGLNMDYLKKTALEEEEIVGHFQPFHSSIKIQAQEKIKKALT